MLQDVDSSVMEGNVMAKRMMFYKSFLLLLSQADLPGQCKLLKSVSPSVNHETAL